MNFVFLLFSFSYFGACWLRVTDAPESETAGKEVSTASAFYTRCVKSNRESVQTSDWPTPKPRWMSMAEELNPLEFNVFKKKKRNRNIQVIF